MLFIDSRVDAEAWLNGGATEPATVQGLDLLSLDGAFGAVSVRGCTFLGCTIGDNLAAKIRADGAGIVSEL